MAKTAIRLAAILGLFTVAACETSDLGRAGMGAGTGYLVDRATGGDGTVGAAVGTAERRFAPKWWRTCASSSGG